MKYVWLMINWVLGALFVIMGLSFVIVSPLAALCLLAAAALLIPPIRNLVFTKTNIKIPAAARALAVLVLLFGSTFIAGNSAVKKSNEIAEKQAKERAEQVEIRRQKAAEEFSSNRANIISSIEQALVEKKYDQVIAETNKYLSSGDETLKKLQTTAKDAMALIAKTEKTNQLLAELSKTSAEDSVKNSKIYQELARLNPENQEYKAKESLYASKIQEADRAKKIQGSKAVVDEVEARFKKNTEHLKKYYGTSDQVKQATSDILKLASVKALYEKSDKKDEKNLSSRADSLMSNVAQQQRVLYASATEEIFMKSGLNIDVSVRGTKKEQLHLKYALMSQPLVYKFQNEVKIPEQARVFGFKKITYTDGYDETWNVDL